MDMSNKEAPMSNESAIPVFPCSSPEETLEFYEAIGFEVTYRQTKPYVYLAVKRGGFDLHFYGSGTKTSEGTFAMCLVMIDEVGPQHGGFTSALKAKYGKVPTAGIPRITRLREGQKRFTLIDPCGNSIIFIARDEPQYEYPNKEAWAKLTPMGRALATAANFRDSRGMDESAAKTLDLALTKNPDAAPIERACALAARAELAIAMGDPERARTAREELEQIPLTEEERELYRVELRASDAIEQMQG
jgi:catechol 2,3-dioxygenase-like lactoylglutathione lyase family enzyme